MKNWNPKDTAEALYFAIKFCRQLFRQSANFRLDEIIKRAVKGYSKFGVTEVDICDGFAKSLQEDVDFLHALAIVSKRKVDKNTKI